MLRLTLDKGDVQTLHVECRLEGPRRVAVVQPRPDLVEQLGRKRLFIQLR